VEVRFGLWDVWFDIRLVGVTAIFYFRCGNMLWLEVVIMVVNIQRLSADLTGGARSCCGTEFSFLALVQSYAYLRIKCCC
jgi:hypothetical protein